LAISAKSFAIF